MIATKKLYEFVRDLIATIPDINHFDWWNNNIINDGIQTSYPTPAVFFEYNTIVWESSTAGTDRNCSTGTPEQKGIGEFTLHIIYKKIESSAIDAAEVSHLDIVAQVYKKVHFSGLSETFIEGPLQRIRDEQVLAHTVLRNWSVAFSFNIFEIAEADPNVEDVFPWTDDVQIEAVDANLNPVPPYLGPGEGITFTIKKT